MSTSQLIIVALVLAAFAFFAGRARAWSVAANAGGIRSLHSLPIHHGALVALWCLLPVLLLVIGWKLIEPVYVNGLVADNVPADIAARGEQSVSLYRNEVENLAADGDVSDVSDDAKRVLGERLISQRASSRTALSLLAIALALGGAAFAYRRIAASTKARHSVESVVRFLLVSSASIAILTTLGIVLSVLFESMRFFQQVNFIDFVTGTSWSPQTAIRVDQIGSSGSFGAIPLFTGTLLISAIALLVAVPFGLMSAIYLAEYATPRVRSVAKPLLEILAGIPTVVYGFFAALTVAPAMRDFGQMIGLSVSSESALAAGMVMGIMIIPFVSSLSDDVITAVPQAMRDGSYALGSTQSETVRKVVIPAALPGIVGGILLAASRAIGETMIVVMAAGLAANLTANPLEAVTTVTVQIVTLLTGDQEFDSAKTLAAFALGLMLFVVTLVLNVIALYVVRRYREQYE